MFMSPTSLTQQKEVARPPLSQCGAVLGLGSIGSEHYMGCDKGLGIYMSLHLTYPSCGAGLWPSPLSNSVLLGS